MAYWTCEAPHCTRQAAVFYGICWFCGVHLCADHVWNSDIHPCERTDGSVDTGVLQVRVSEDRLRQLLAKLDLQSIKLSAEAFRPGHLCELLAGDMSDISPSGPYFIGGTNLHIPLIWNDGKKWVARVRKIGQLVPPPEGLVGDVLSEAATFRALKDGGVRVPEVWFNLEEIKSNPIKFFFVEYVHGQDHAPLMSPDSHLIPTDPTVKTIYNIAKWYIDLEKVSFPSVGSLTFDDKGKVIVGPVIDQFTFRGSAPFHLGPYPNAKARYLDHFEQIMQHILDGNWSPPSAQLHHYLICLEMKTLVEEYMEQDTGPYYTKHGEPKGDHFRFGQGEELIAAIDWEKAVLTCKAEAFAAPWGFVTSSYIQGDNSLCPFEIALIDAYINLGREDLAAFVRQGKKWQRLDQALRGWQPGLATLNAARRAWKGEQNGSEDDPIDDTAWLHAAYGRYERDEGVKKLLERLAA